MELKFEISLPPAELGVQGAQLRTQLLTNCQLRPAFSRKKNIENPSKIDLVRDKTVNCAPIFQELPPALGPDPRIHQGLALPFAVKNAQILV